MATFKACIYASYTMFTDQPQKPPESEIDHEEVITRGLAKLALGPVVGDVVDTNPGPNSGALPLDTSDMLVAMATCPGKYLLISSLDNTISKLQVFSDNKMEEITEHYHNPKFVICVNFQKN